MPLCILQIADFFRSEPWQIHSSTAWWEEAGRRSKRHDPFVKNGERTEACSGTNTITDQLTRRYYYVED